MPPKKEETQEQTDVQQTPKKGAGPLVIILLIFNMLLVGALGAYMVLFNGQGAKETAAKTDSETNDSASGNPAIDAGNKVGPIIELEPFLVNLDEPGSNRYLKAVIQLEVESADVAKDLEARSVQIKDLIITYLSSLTYAQTQGVGNKDIIRITLVKQINKKLAKGKVKTLYFTEFVIQ
jgi:flagellar FliL protein